MENEINSWSGFEYDRDKLEQKSLFTVFMKKKLYQKPILMYLLMMSLNH